ncbi:MAG TPA: endonuclease domain-containing protein [Verrucomicrobiae bacterium]|jgi:very-short-patch-repair endonuclease|nr:endonuclease domain-containing protein [Verrucomicrobiae bacterium]
MTTARAQLLRKRMTDAERRLWSKLRMRQVEGFRFRRQAPVGPYVVDFICLELKLIVEVDGGQHAMPRADAKRTAWLESEGYRVIRFWNNDVLKNTEAVLQSLYEALKR